MDEFQKKDLVHSLQRVKLWFTNDVANTTTRLCCWVHILLFCAVTVIINVAKYSYCLWANNTKQSNQERKIELACIQTVQSMNSNEPERRRVWESIRHDHSEIWSFQPLIVPCSYQLLSEDVTHFPLPTCGHFFLDLCEFYCFCNGFVPFSLKSMQIETKRFEDCTVSFRLVLQVKL